MFAQPTVSGNLLFIGSCSGKFLALDKTSGKEVWSYDTTPDGGPFGFHGDPLIHENLVLIPADLGCERGGYVYAFETKTGKLRWKLRAGAPGTNFAVAGNAVVFGTRRDEWISVEINSGKVQWEFKDAAPDPACDFPKTPATDGVTLALVSHDQVLHLLDLKSGRELRHIKLPSRATTGLFMYKDVLYFGTEDGRLRSLNPGNGQWLDDRDIEVVLHGRFSSEGQRPKPFTEYAFGSWTRQDHKNGMIVAFEDEFEKLLWSRQSEDEWTSTEPHPWKSWVIAGNCRGDVVAYRATDGEVAWREHLQGCIRSFGHDDSTLYIGAQEGTVYAYRPK